MKIAIIGSNKFDTLEFHLKDELTHQGHNVKIFDLDDNFIPKKISFVINKVSEKFSKKINENLFKKVLTFEPDLIIGTYRHIHPSLVKKAKNEKIKIIHINPDQLTTLQNQQIFVEKYDAYFTKDYFMLEFMKEKMKLNTFHYNEAFNPRFHSLYSNNFKEIENKINIDVLSFGNLYPYRNRMLKEIIKNKIKISVYGNKTKYFPNNLNDFYKNKAIFGEEKSQVLSGSKIVFNNFHYAEIQSVNNKFFEINGVGAFQICDYKPILHELLPIDPKIVSFKNLDEAIKKIKYFLNEPEHRYEIRKEMYNHFNKNYTYKNLINLVFENVFNN